ncbi:putative lipid II flippase FtsW [Spirochaetota bacterium]
MYRNYSTAKASPDFTLMITIILLVLIGVSIVYSSSFIYAEKLTGDSLFFFKNHIITLCIAIVFFMIGYFMNPEIILKAYKVLVVMAILLLIAVLIPGVGRKVSGAKRWISLGFFRMQPSVIAKFAVIVYLSMLLTMKSERLNLFTKGILPPLIFIAIISFLIILQPDVSSAAIIIIISFFMFFTAGVPLLHIATVACINIPFFVLLIERKRYVLDRLIFFNPYDDPYGRGYHLIQSFKSFRLGGIKGLGPGNSVQKISNLPEAHTDFIFSVIGEETGFIGCLFIMLIFGVFFYKGITITRRIEDKAFSLLAFGITISIFFQALYHIMVVTGLAPTTGMPLPFISYGRTSLVINMLMAGILLGLSRMPVSGDSYA